MKTITVIQTSIKNFPSFKQLNVRTMDGRLTCIDESLFAAIQAAEGSTLDVELDANRIIGVTGAAPAATTADTDDDAIDESIDTAPAETKPAAPKTTKVEAPVADGEEGVSDAAKRAAVQWGVNHEEGRLGANPEAKPAPKKTYQKKAATPAVPDRTWPDNAKVIVEKNHGITQTTVILNADKQPNGPRRVYASELLHRVDRIVGSPEKPVGCALVTYIDARTVYDILDEWVGPFGWATEYSVLDGKLYCCMKVRNPENNQWGEKMDVGTPSDFEGEKGCASDAAKRAGVQWRINRESYSLKDLFVYANNTVIEKNSKGKLECYDEFITELVVYDGTDIVELVLRSKKTGAEALHFTRNPQ